MTATSDSPANLSPGDSVCVILQWQALASIDTDYTVFAHIRNPIGEIVTQKDGPPASGAYPTSLWEAGEVIKDDFTIPLEQLEPGQYELVVGLYDPSTGKRLPVEGRPDDAVWVHQFEISER